jgi:hypothetical protein
MHPKHFWAGSENEIIKSKKAKNNAIKKMEVKMGRYMIADEIAD